MATIITPAIVLRHRAYRDSDRVVTLFTRDHGLIVGMARGVRKSTRRFGGRLDLFELVELEYRPGRGELVNLQAATLLSAHMGIRDDLYKIAWSGYFSELIERVYGTEEPHPNTFTVLTEILNYLDRVQGPAEGVLRAQELRILEEGGLLPELEQCVSCRIRVHGASHRFSFSLIRGGPICDRCLPVEQGSEAPIAAMLKLAHAWRLPMEALQQVVFSDEETQGARRLLSAFVRYQLGTQLRSAQFLESLEG